MIHILAFARVLFQPAESAHDIVLRSNETKWPGPLPPAGQLLDRPPAMKYREYVALSLEVNGRIIGRPSLTVDLARKISTRVTYRRSKSTVTPRSIEFPVTPRQYGKHDPREIESPASGHERLPASHTMGYPQICGSRLRSKVRRVKLADGANGWPSCDQFP